MGKAASFYMINDGHYGLQRGMSETTNTNLTTTTESGNHRLR